VTQWYPSNVFQLGLQLIAYDGVLWGVTLTFTLDTPLIYA